MRALYCSSDMPEPIARVSLSLMWVMRNRDKSTEHGFGSQFGNRKNNIYKVPTHLDMYRVDYEF
jgi:hypothetical protein